MKKRFKIFGKLIAITIIIIICDSVLHYLFNIIVSYIFEGPDAYVFHFNPLGFIGSTFMQFFLIAGWAYLLAMILYHIYRVKTYFRSKFLVIIFLFVVFYVIVDTQIQYADFFLTTVIYFAILSVIYFTDKWQENTSVLFIILMMLFYYYWLEDNFDYQTLVIHTLTYIPLAVIGRKLYNRFFPEQKVPV